MAWVLESSNLYSNYYKNESSYGKMIKFIVHLGCKVQLPLQFNLTIWEVWENNS